MWYMPKKFKVGDKVWAKGMEAVIVPNDTPDREYKVDFENGFVGWYKGKELKERME